MARATDRLIAALGETIERLESSEAYQWGHMGMCNCGFLAQTVTGLRSEEIHESAMAREGDWGEQARLYCPTSGLMIDTILASLFDIGMSANDVRGLERLSDPRVLRRLGGRHLRHNVRDDVLLYMRAWLEILRESRPDPRRSTELTVAGSSVV